MASNKAKSNETADIRVIGNKKNILINNFNKLRDIIRIIYLYSSYDNQEVFKVSPRKLREEKLRIRNIFNQNYKDSYENSKKYFGLFYDSVINSKNFLSKIYFIKTFTDLDFILYFFIFEVLNDGDLSVEEILAIYEEKSAEGDGTIFREVTSSTVERHLKAMVENGLIERIKDGKKYLYRNKEEFFEGFSLEEKEDILQMAMFFSEITPYKAYGHYLQETIKSDVDIMRLDYYDNDNNYLDWYYFSGNHIHNILDEIILYCIEQSRFVEIENEDIKMKVCYLYHIVDPVYGRMYVLTRAIDGENMITEEHVIFRLDKIKNVKPIKKKPFNYKEVIKSNDSEITGNSNRIKINNNEITENGNGIKGNYSEITSNRNKIVIDGKDRIKMWNCSIPMDKVVSLEPEVVEAIFYFDEELDEQIYQRLLREKKWATLEKQSDGGYLFRIEVLDKKELIPWFRTFEGYVVVLDKEINEKFAYERGELLKRYGVL